MAYRRVHRHPLFHALVVHNKFWLLVLLVGIPCLGVGLLVFERTHTNYYLLTGPPGGTTALLGGEFTEVLNKPVKLERILHLNLIPDFYPMDSCGALTNIASLNAGTATPRSLS
ncbi:MAG: hypothetical protein M3Z35_15280 [Nitrospirota bacterium]|nr:hypothetical protein [Nitrospirota bacterium]